MASGIRLPGGTPARARRTQDLAGPPATGGPTITRLDTSETCMALSTYDPGKYGTRAF